MDEWNVSSRTAFRSKFSDLTALSDLSFHLRGFSADHDYSRAIFALDHLLDNTERRDDLIFRRLWERVLLGDPPLSIKACHAINDTPLPDLQIDQRLKTLSLCW